jgi:hypothetical protein
MSPAVAAVATKDSIIARLNAAKAGKVAAAVQTSLPSPFFSPVSAPSFVASSPAEPEGDLEEVSLSSTSSSVM